MDMSGWFMRDFLHVQDFTFESAVGREHACVIVAYSQVLFARPGALHLGSGLCYSGMAVHGDGTNETIRSPSVIIGPKYQKGEIYAVADSVFELCVPGCRIR